jgi:hypothetical protein
MFNNAFLVVLVQCTLNNINVQKLYAWGFKCLLKGVL